jgi:hypothetical protein
MPNKYPLIAITLVSLFSASIFNVKADEIRSTLSGQTNVAVTIYNNNLALIKDQRAVNLPSGVNTLALRDVSAQIKPETALLRSLNHAAGFHTIEQNFDFDVLTPQKLLEKYVGKHVSVVRTNPSNGMETTESAQVLSANNGIVIKIGNRIETGIPGRIVYEDVPPNLRDRPTLVTKINNKTAAEHLLELSYLTGGLSWKADYVAALNPKEDKLDLSAWVTLTNTSGTSYQNAKLQLVAGDVNRVPERNPRTLMMHKAAEDIAAAPNMAEESLLEYHLYSLEQNTSIAENQTKQVALLSAKTIPVRKSLLLRGADYYYGASYGDLGQKLKVSVFVEFDNKEATKLGMPLPKGIMRIYKQDSQGNSQFVGEDQIDHTPKNETVKLKLGDAFDVTADKKQVDFKTLPRPEKGNSLFESAYEIVLKNAKNEAVMVTVQEPIPGDWKLLKESHPSQKSSSNTATWNIKIPAQGKVTLSYRAQVKY